MATHIPGYYYDVDKNRYFKITSERPAPSRPQRPPSLDPPTGARVICKVNKSARAHVRTPIRTSRIYLRTTPAAQISLRLREQTPIRPCITRPSRSVLPCGLRNLIERCVPCPSFPFKAHCATVSYATSIRLHSYDVQLQEMKNTELGRSWIW